MNIIIPIVIIIIILILIACVWKLKKSSRFSGSGSSASLTKSLSELKKLLGSSELGQFMNPNIWANYSTEVSITTTKLTTEITKITANPVGLLTNVLISPECVRFLLRSAPKALVAKFRNAKNVFKYVKGKVKKDKDATLGNLTKEMIKPYIEIYIELIIMVYKKDLYQPFISPVLQLVYDFPLLTVNLKKAIQRLYSIYECETIKAILYKSIDTILNSDEKMKSIYALFSGLVSTVLSNMENVILTFSDEVKRLIKNGGKAIEDNAVNMLSDKINKSLNNLSIQNVLKDSELSKTLTSEISKLGSVASLLNGGDYSETFETDLFYDIIDDEMI